MGRNWAFYFAHRAAPWRAQVAPRVGPSAMPTDRDPIPDVSDGTPAVLAQTLARRWPSPAVLAISGG